MTRAEQLRIAIRYTFAAGQGYLSTFLSALSIAGLVLAISLLIVVLSVMNGFDKEMRERILSLVPHITIYSYEPIQDWQEWAASLKHHPKVEEVAPFAQFDTLIMRGSNIETARGIGLEAQDPKVMARLAQGLDARGAESFINQGDGLILGAGIARRLGVVVGERLTLVVPGAVRSQGAASTRFQTVHLSAVLDTGTELDEALALVHLPLASELAGLDGSISGFRLTTSELFEVEVIARELQSALPPGYYGTNWKMTHGNLYAAIQLSRDLVSILLFSIIAVAAFNVVSSLVLVVMDKQGSIAILRTMGATGGDIAWIFVLQGAMIGVVGAVAGSVLGALASLAVPGLVSRLEQLLDFQFLSTDVYPVSFLPVDLLAGDIIAVGLVALGMCIVAAIYPALRGARLAPAMILNQDR